MMKQADKKELDLLLRSLAKIKGGGLDNSTGPSEHLDADELSSYAEDVLPSAARARYTAHLAECERCRKMVTNLAMAAGATTKFKDDLKEAPATFWSRLTELFSPAVLRYAVPALVLLAIIGVAFVSMRRENNDVARNEQPTSSPTSVNSVLTNQTAQTAQPNQSEPGNRPMQNSEGTSSPSNPSAQKTGEESSAEKRSSDQSRSKTTPADSVATSQPSYAPEPAAPPPPQAGDRAAKVETAINTRQQEAPAKENDAVSRDENVAGTKAQRSDAPAATPKSKNSPFVGGIVAQRRVADLEDKKSPNNEVAKTSRAKDDRATRTVAGRSFYRDGNMWIDTVYSSSQALTIVRRGSEQYRGLIADEPDLKSIDQALGGTLIVVWKGRAYRIQ